MPEPIYEDPKHLEIIERLVAPGEAVEAVFDLSQTYAKAQGGYELLAVTSRRLIHTGQGWVNGPAPQHGSLPYREIRGVTLDTRDAEGASLFGLFKSKGYTQVDVSTRGGAPIETRFTFWGSGNVDKAQQLHDLILHHMDLASAKQSSPGPTEHSNRAFLDQLERLAALRRSGALTEEEFQKAKEKLLSG